MLSILQGLNDGLESDLIAQDKVGLGRGSLTTLHSPDLSNPEITSGHSQQFYLHKHVTNLVLWNIMNKFVSCV